MPIYRKGDDQFGLREAAQDQRRRDEWDEKERKYNMGSDDQSGFTGARMAFSPFIGGVKADMKFAPVSGDELAKEAARIKAGAKDRFGRKNYDHKVDPVEQYEKGAY